MLEKNSSEQREISQRLDDMMFDEDNAHDYVVADIVNSAVFDDNDGKIEGLYYLVH